MNTTSVPVRLNLGSGPTKVPGFINVDANPEAQADIQTNIDDLPFQASSVDTIYASHVLEHYCPRESLNPSKEDRVLSLLSYWNSLLKPGGELFIAVPDFERLSEIYLEHRETESIRKTVIDAIFGGQRNPFDFHYIGFSQASLEILMKKSGFDQIQKFEAFLNDETKHKVNGTNISLNLKGVKTGEGHLQKFTPVLAAEDELTLLRRAADERLAGMIEQKKYITFLEESKKNIEEAYENLRNSPKLLVKNLFKSLKKMTVGE